MFILVSQPSSIIHPPRWKGGRIGMGSDSWWCYPNWFEECIIKVRKLQITGWRCTFLYSANLVNPDSDGKYQHPPKKIREIRRIRDNPRFRQNIYGFLSKHTASSPSCSYSISDTCFCSHSQTSLTNSHASRTSHLRRCSTATTGMSDRTGSLTTTKETIATETL